MTSLTYRYRLLFDTPSFLTERLKPTELVLRLGGRRRLVAWLISAPFGSRPPLSPIIFWYLNNSKKKDIATEHCIPFFILHILSSGIFRDPDNSAENDVRVTSCSVELGKNKHAWES